ncbi:MAG: hypothetical protein HPY83_02650 [Anaerolineae bacterium]|nr:hypothetical protein [Anaerolineae bacterium]
MQLASVRLGTGAVPDRSCWMASATIWATRARASCFWRGYLRPLPFGLVPCPLTAFTQGLLLWSEKGLPRYILVMPVLYSLSGVIPVSLGIVEDVGLVLVGLSSAGLVLLSAPGGAMAPADGGPDWSGRQSRMLHRSSMRRLPAHSRPTPLGSRSVRPAS